MDTTWIGSLPGNGQWGLAPPNSDINYLSTLVGFVDSNWVLNGESLTSPSTYVYMLPVDSGYDITATISNTSTNWTSQVWSIYGDSGSNSYWESAPTSTTLGYLDGCTTTSFELPCVLTSNISLGGYKSTATFKPLDYFFGP
jgi:hypothetical protein